MSETELKAQLARTEQALLEAEKEIDRQRRAAAADAEIPEGAKALIAAVSKGGPAGLLGCGPGPLVPPVRVSVPPRRDRFIRG